MAEKLNPVQLGAVRPWSERLLEKPCPWSHRFPTWQSWEMELFQGEWMETKHSQQVESTTVTRSNQETTTYGKQQHGSSLRCLGQPEAWLLQPSCHHLHLHSTYVFGAPSRWSQRPWTWFTSEAKAVTSSKKRLHCVILYPVLCILSATFFPIRRMWPRRTTVTWLMRATPTLSPFFHY